MAKERIVIQTSDRRKAELVKTLELQGDSISDWIAEQLVISVPTAARALEVDAIRAAAVSDLSNPKSVFTSLREQDWAFTNDDTSYLTHDLHPYPAKFIPQIPARLIAALSSPGDLVFDPFGGSATTAVEAARLGRRAISLDANPLSGIIGRVKTGCMMAEVRAELEQLQATVGSYLSSADIKKSGWTKKTSERHANLVPSIPNLSKWFHQNAVAELALIRYLIDEISSGLARDAALLALSRIINRVSFQESETRYVAQPKDIPVGLALRGFQESLRTIMRRLEHAASELQHADCRFIVGDSRNGILGTIEPGSVNLIVTSPPYPNATDYHLYHRFRLFWLGYDPRRFGNIEIGSHLRHQRDSTGFDDYNQDMRFVLEGCYSALQPGRYAVFIVGDAIFRGKTFSTSEAIARTAQDVGFQYIGSIDRPIHATKRSFSLPAQRARKEQLVILRKPDAAVAVTLIPPTYRMWGYETLLRKLEIEALSGARLEEHDLNKPVVVQASQQHLSAFRRLTFSREFIVDEACAHGQPTWQKVLENGDAEGQRRKDPKYVTHGIHPYKGKFYPQLAKSLINISGVAPGARILDPYCGSGTVLLEGMLNGFATFGCDMNPLAAKIARAKTEFLSIEVPVAEQALRSLLERVKRSPARFKASRAQFGVNVLDELDRWFPEPVLNKLEWLLTQIRLFGDQRIVEFCEVILSSLIRDVSQQDPADLRIRRRKELLNDAPVIEIFRERLQLQLERLEKYWSIMGRQPGALIPAVCRDGDCRQISTFNAMGLGPNTVDCVVTSPPYATALPYIDTDRLSLMAIMGVPSEVRSDLEERLTGSREIRKRTREQLEKELEGRQATTHLPKTVVSSLRGLLKANRAGNVGFRRENMAALLWRYFSDMQQNISVVSGLLRPGGCAFYVVGDSRTNAGGEWVPIETCRHLREIAAEVGLETETLLDISVTTENFRHIKNAITENAVLCFRKPR